MSRADYRRGNASTEQGGWPAPLTARVRGGSLDRQPPEGSLTPVILRRPERPRTRRFARALPALALCLLGQAALGQGAAPATEQFDLTVTVEDARAIALDALAAGNTELAYVAARQLLLVEPDDFTGLIVLAGAAPDLGRADEGRRAAARAYAIAGSDLARFEAARYAGIAAAKGERFLLAEFWLRRALQHAPTDAAYERTVQTAGRVRRASPLSIRLSAAVSPIVNTGSDEAISLGDGGFDTASPTRPQGQLTYSAEIRVRVQEGPRSETGVTLSYQGAQDRIEVRPTLSDDYVLVTSTDELEVGLDHRRTFASGLLAGEVHAGATYRDGEALHEFRGFSLRYLRPLSQGDQLSVAFARDWKDGATGAYDLAIRDRLSLTHEQVLPRGNRLSLTAGADVQSSDAPNYDYRAGSIGLSYEPDILRDRLDLTLSASARQKVHASYDTLVAPPQRREDRTLGLTLAAGFPQAAFYGFEPSISVTHEWNDSSIEEFSSSTSAVSFRVETVF